MIILAEISPYDPVLGAERIIRMSSGTGTPIFNGAHWPARLGHTLVLGMAIFENDFETAGSSRTAGGLQIINGDGGFDDLTGYSWDQRDIKIWTGDSDDFNDFILRFDGFVSGVTYNEKTLDLTLGDKSNIFDALVDFPTYLGTGGTEGPVEMTGIVKPFCFGPVFNMEPTLADATNQIYQVHNRAIQAIGGVFDQAVALTPDGDTADLGAWAAVPGKYKTDLSKGLFRLGAKPAGLVTADIQGDNVGGYVSSAGDILQRLLDFIPDSAAVTVDAAAFTALNLANGSAVSIHARAALNARDLFNVCLRSIGGFWLVDWLGNLTVGIHDIKTPAGSLTDRHISSMTRLESPAPIWRLKTTYRPTYRVQSGSEIAAADLGGGIRSGAGAPASNLGIIDDLYIDSDDGKLYKKTAISTWTFQYDTTGPTGTDGDTWLDGAGAPAGSLGSVGDYYLNSANGNYYKKTGANIWTLQGNIAGPQGDDGATGSDGLDGSPGTDGAAGPQGVPGPPGADGTPRYIWVAYADSADGVTNFTNGAPGTRKYLGLAPNKTSSTESSNPADYNWSKIEGDTGPQGNTGATGSTGNTGVQGVQGPQGPVGPNGEVVSYRQTTPPSSPADGEIWFETDTNILWLRKSSAWQIIGTYNDGVLADLDFVNTAQIVDNAVTSGGAASVTGPVVGTHGATLVSKVLATNGGDIFITVSASHALPFVNALFKFTLERDGAEIAVLDNIFSGATRQTIALASVDIGASAANHTFAVKVYHPTGSSALFYDVTLFVLEFKK
ncbi:MAG: hypothetical protein COB49_09530 [Alphaproteobacteria bacterium]|nr:MAG: hypothetical protein COB49_09530 [Alphaproteobacteria bacterium]